jgi:VIT1/CCC1 family predicted Fe2+/Mn2+ transporter
MMNDKLNAAPAKPRTYWGVYSIILGIIGAIIPIITIRLYGGHGSGPAYREYPASMVISGICIILGFIFGFVGLKSVRKKAAKIGIIVCTLSILWLIVFIGGWLIWTIF